MAALQCRCWPNICYWHTQTYPSRSGSSASEGLADVPLDMRLLPDSTIAKTTLLAGVLMTFAPGIASAQPIEKNGTIAYVAHLVIRPLFSSDVARLGSAASLEKGASA
jgi:hypothetical protein